MLKKREGYKVIVNEEAQERIKNDQCPSCGKPKSEWTRRTDWRCCSTKCTGIYVKEMVCYGWPELRMMAFERDGFICAKCNKIPVKEEWNRNMSKKEFKKYMNQWHKVLLYRTKEIEGRKRLVAVLVDDSSLVGDHIIPIALGGDEWELKNVQSLCSDCNKIKTKEDAGKIAAARRVINKLQKGQQQLRPVLTCKYCGGKVRQHYTDGKPHYKACKKCGRVQ